MEDHLKHPQLILLLKICKDLKGEKPLKDFIWSFQFIDQEVMEPLMFLKIFKQFGRIQLTQINRDKAFFMMEGPSIHLLKGMNTLTVPKDSFSLMMVPVYLNTQKEVIQ